MHIYLYFVVEVGCFVLSSFALLADYAARQLSCWPCC